jgi:hypothetical protein
MMKFYERVCQNRRGGQWERERPHVSVRDVVRAVAKVCTTACEQVRQERVVQSAGEPDDPYNPHQLTSMETERPCHTPEGNQQASAERHLAGSEQRTDVLRAIPRVLRQDTRLSILLPACDVKVLLLDVHLAAVVHRDGLDSFDCLSVATPSEQETGRLVQRKHEEAKRPEEQRDGPDREDEVAPAHVVRLETRLNTLGARETRDERPCDLISSVSASAVFNRAKDANQGGDELADTPPYRKKRKQILVRARNELEEDGRVDGHVSADTEPSEGEQARETDE